MAAYADSSFLVAVYAIEPQSLQALNWITNSKQSLIYTPFHRHELRTAIRQKVFRGETTIAARNEAFRDIDSDLQDRILIHTQIPWTDAFREAERVGAEHGETQGTRSLDLLHVGIALALKTKLFLSYDGAQRELARQVGLKLAF